MLGLASRGDSAENTVKCFWLIPITRSERDFKAEQGLATLEQRFEEANFDYLDPTRRAVV